MNIYIHIPFCAQNCSYCTFQKIISCDQDAHRSYFEALKKEMQVFSCRIERAGVPKGTCLQQLRNQKHCKQVGYATPARSQFSDSARLKEGNMIKTLYFGGGTPSLISPEILTDFFDFLKKKYRFSPRAEITLECHPTTVSKEKIQAWKACGINRISLGVQTFQTKFDRFLERNLSHTQKALDLLLQSNFQLSIDLIFGFPQQTIQDLQADIDQIKNLNLEHISFYALDYKVGSKIEKEEDERLEFETLCSFYDLISKELTKQGFEHYEIYNFSKNQQCSKHNLNFWRGEDYVGFGLSAVSGIGKTVRENTCNMKKYVQGDWLESQYDLDKDEILEIFIKRRLRLISGLGLKELKSFCSSDAVYEQILENAKTVPSWLHLNKTHLALTQEGRMSFMEVIELLLGE